MNGYFNYRDELYHHGVLGMKWGVRRYQSYADNPKLSDRQKKRLAKDAHKAFKKNKVSAMKMLKGKKSKSFGKNTEEVINRYKKEADDNPYEKRLKEMDKEAVELNKKYKGQMKNETVKRMAYEFNKEYQENMIKNSEYGEKIAEKYIKEMNTALVKDLNIPHAEEVGDYITNNMPMWDKTYIYNYAWQNALT